jgi:hypothetical protein
MKCKICGRDAQRQFTARVLDKHSGDFYSCCHCGFLFAADPVWLDEAYGESITVYDTGIMWRNNRLAKITAALLFHLFDKGGRFLDYAGGYGILTRLMRDSGFEFYWHDPYSQNLVARGFEADFADSFELVTSFESFEHFFDPRREIEKMLGLSRNILFTTELMPSPIPAPSDWWYYGFAHGQHIAFYAETTLDCLAATYNLHRYSYKDVHLLTERPVSKQIYRYLVKYANSWLLVRKIKKHMRSKRNDDMEYLLRRKQPE